MKVKEGHPVRTAIRLSLPLMVVAAMVAAATPASAAPCMVPSATYPDLQTAENDPTCDPIVVAAGVFGPVDIDRNLTIQGAGAGATFIEGTSGSAGILADTGTATITVTGVTIRNGTYTPGAGIYTNPGITLNLISSIVEQNHSSGEVGGIYNGGTMTIQDSAIRDNSSTGRAGGIWLDGNLTIIRSLIEGNTTGSFNAGHGAGIYMYDPNNPTLTITDSTMSGNKAFGTGGALYATDTVTMNNVTIANNTADENVDGVGDGGGFYRQNGTLTLSNTIVAGNQDRSTGADPQHPDCSGEVASNGYNLVESLTGCTITGNLTGSVTGSSPALLPLQANGGPTETHAFASTSPAFDAGNPAAPGSSGSACSTTDQRGVARPQFAGCDIGAFELQAPSAPAVTCLGKPATIQGTAGPDQLAGTGKADVIAALGGKDTVKGLGGKDRICAGAGDDKASGQGGADQILGQAGDDRLKGQGGGDTLKGGGGEDQLAGGGGKDRCRGGPGPDEDSKCE